MKLFEKLLVIGFLFMACLWIGRGDAAPGTSYDVLGWWDTFEQDTCGAEITKCLPNGNYAHVAYGYTYTLTGGGPDVSTYQVVDCTKSVPPGTKSYKSEYGEYMQGEDPGGAYIGIGYPQGAIIPGHVLVYQDYLYIPDPNQFGDPNIYAEGYFRVAGGGCCSQPLDLHYVGTVDPNDANGNNYKWQYTILDANGVKVYADSNVPVQMNTWLYLRTEVYDPYGNDANDWNYSVWVTPAGGAETPIALNAPCQRHTYPGPYGAESYRSTLAIAKGLVYWDNVRISLTQLQCQGFPTIGTIASPITIDGVIDASEWAGVKEIAQKPLGFQHGDFTANRGPMYADVVDANKWVDVYTAYDNNNIYVAAKFNKVTVGDPNYYFQAVFTWDSNDPNKWYDPNGWLDDRNYVFGCRALHASAQDDNDLFAYRLYYSGSGPTYWIQSNWMDANTLNYNIVKTKGGAFSYTVSGGVMQVEMRIPFTALVDRPIKSTAGTVRILQFSTSCLNYGGFTEYTDNYIGYITTCLEQTAFPFTAGWVNWAPYGAGITFPKTGDFNGDGSVNFLDYAMLAKNWMQNTSSAVDMNKDGKVDMKDMKLFVAQWLK